MKYALLGICMFLTACTTPPPLIKVETKEVQVIVTQPYPPVATLPRPTLEITKIREGQSPGAVVQAYQITIQQLINFVEQLETQIAGVNKTASQTPIAK